MNRPTVAKRRSSSIGPQGEIAKSLMECSYLPVLTVTDAKKRFMLGILANTGASPGCAFASHGHAVRAEVPIVSPGKLPAQRNDRP